MQDEAASWGAGARARGECRVARAVCARSAARRCAQSASRGPAERAAAAAPGAPFPRIHSFFNMQNILQIRIIHNTARSPPYYLSIPGWWGGGVGAIAGGTGGSGIVVIRYRV